MRANETASSARLNGPSWLSENEVHCPKTTAACTYTDGTSENSQVVTRLPNKPLEIQWEPFSSWTELIHSICYVLLWRSSNPVKGLISLDEYHNTEQIIFKLVQKEAFTTENETLIIKEELSSKLHIAQFCPFLDEQGTMRARGRLSKADFKFDTKHPILLQSKHHAIRLIMLKCHLDNYHQGVESSRHELLRFVKYMRKALKRWVCVFPCLSTRAIHIEMVYSLVTDSCLTAVTRFIAR